MVTTGVGNIANNNSNLTLAPNPANGVTYAAFTTEQAGRVQITVTNNLGQVVRTITQDFTKGNQRVAISTEGLSAGMYLIKVSLQQGNVARTKLLVK
jgi:hypothetical protein